MNFHEFLGSTAQNSRCKIGIDLEHLCAKHVALSQELRDLKPDAGAKLSLKRLGAHRGRGYISGPRPVPKAEVAVVGIARSAAVPTAAAAM